MATSRDILSAALISTATVAGASGGTTHAEAASFGSRVTANQITPSTTFKNTAVFSSSAVGRPYQLGSRNEPFVKDNWKNAGPPPPKSMGSPVINPVQNRPSVLQSFQRNIGR